MASILTKHPMPGAGGSSRGQVLEHPLSTAALLPQASHPGPRARGAGHRSAVQTTELCSLGGRGDCRLGAGPPSRGGLGHMPRPPGGSSGGASLRHGAPARVCTPCRPALPRPRHTQAGRSAPRTRARVRHGARGRGRPGWGSREDTHQCCYSNLDRATQSASQAPQAPLGTVLRVGRREARPPPATHLPTSPPQKATGPGFWHGPARRPAARLSAGSTPTAAAAEEHEDCA